jgi:hypothetical protein
MVAIGRTSDLDALPAILEPTKTASQILPVSPFCLCPARILTGGWTHYVLAALRRKSTIAAMGKVVKLSQCVPVTATSEFSLSDGFGLKPLTEKDKVYRFFINPLKRMGEGNGDDAFLCLMVCFPLIETIIRHEFAIPHHRPVLFSDDSKALRWFAKFMGIRAGDARTVWDAMRNGLLHLALIAGTIEYEVTGRGSGRPAVQSGNVTKIYIWDLRDCVVKELEKRHRWLWKDVLSRLPDVYFPRLS